MGKIFRQLRVKPQLLPGNGVNKAQRFGMQALAMEAGDAVVRPIDRVACHRMMDGGHVHTNLMGSAGFRRHSSMVNSPKRSNTR